MSFNILFLVAFSKEDRGYLEWDDNTALICGGFGNLALSDIEICSRIEGAFMCTELCIRK